MQKRKRGERCILFDWGDTLMRDIPGQDGPMATWPEVVVLPGAREVLEELQGGWRLALATNAAASDEKDIRAALARGGLDGFWDVIFCYRSVGHRKPSPEFFVHALESLSLPPSACVMVGDAFDSDIVGANRAGIRGVWLNERDGENREGEMYRTIHRLSDLPAVLADWAAIV